MIDKTKVYESKIHLNYSPHYYFHDSSTQFYLTNERLADLKHEYQTQDQASVRLLKKSIYDFFFFDTSQVLVFDFGFKFDIYVVDQEWSNYVLNSTLDKPCFKSSIF